MTGDFQVLVAFAPACFYKNNMTMNALYLCCLAKPWVSVANQLREKFAIEPVYFIHWAEDAALVREIKHSECFFHELEAAWKGLGYPEYVRPKVIEPHVRKKFAHFELIALRMMDRLDPDGRSFSSGLRERFYLELLGKSLDLIDRLSIDIIISPSIPHRVFDFALYVAAKIKGIRFLMFQMTPFEKTTFLIDDIEKIPIFKKRSHRGNRQTELAKDIVEKISLVRGSYETAKPKYMVKQAVKRRQFFIKLAAHFFSNFKKYLRSPNVYWVQASKMPQASHYSWFQFYMMTMKRILKIFKLRRLYRQVCVSKLPSDFVFFALHYQPEETSCPTGILNYDQIQIVERLIAALPEPVSIVVKEHPSQFNPFMEGSCGRTLDYYERLRCLSQRVFLVPENVDPFDLVEKASAVITISGTIGWEAVLRGVPAFVFGRAWYGSMPGVLKVDSIESIKQAFSNLAVVKSQINDEALIDYHKEMEGVAIRAVHYKAFLDSDFDEETSAAELTRGITEYLNIGGDLDSPFGKALDQKCLRSVKKSSTT